MRSGLLAAGAVEASDLEERPAHTYQMRALDVVFDEWTDAARLAEWMCPRPARCLNVEADARIGGTLGFDIEEAGRTFRVSGNYLTLERPHRVAFTSELLDMAGPDHPDRRHRDDRARRHRGIDHDHQA